MCLAVPMKIISIEGDFAVVEAGRIRQRACIQMLPKVKTGDYVLIHAGFAIEKVDSQKARESLRMFDEIR